MSSTASTARPSGGAAARRRRSDAVQNAEALLDAAKALFGERGVDVPARAIAERAGVGVGTLYRHFPLRSDLISAVFRREIDACVDAATEYEGSFSPGEALDRWVMRYTQFVATKRGLAEALDSGNPAYQPLAEYFSARLAPTLERLLEAAERADAIHQGVEATELLLAVGNLCRNNGPIENTVVGSDRMVRLLLAGLRVPPTR